MKPPDPVHTGTSAGRGVIFAVVLGSGMAFIDGLFINVALPAIDEELGLGVAGFQWVVSGYLLSLSSLLLLGGNLGDRYGRRRIYLVGMAAFAAASAACGLAVSTEMLIASRLIQGAGAALMVPASLAIIQAVFAPEERGKAIGLWTGMSSIFIAAGPFVGGLFVTYASWRWAFLINLPITVVGFWATLRWVPENRSEDEQEGTDVLGAFLLVGGLGAVLYWVIEGIGAPATWPLYLAIGGVVALIAFVALEAKVKHPLVPLSIFKSTQFDWINLCTLLFYGAFGAGITLVILRLQVSLGYSALAAGVATLPVNLFMLVLASRFGAWGQRIGAKWPMTLGPALVAVALAVMSQIDAGDSYWTAVFPAILIWGLGLSMTVAPLTAAALAAADQRYIGLASAMNNAASRVGQAFGIAAIPALAGMASGASLSGPSFAGGYDTALLISAGLCLVAAGLAFVFVSGEGDASSNDHAEANSSHSRPAR